MNIPLALAGVLALAGAAVHGIVGGRLVRRIDPKLLPPSPIGGPGSTFTLIEVSWHLVTLTFLLSGVALLWIGAMKDPQIVRGVGAFLLALYSAFAMLAVGAALARRASGLLRHPAPIGFCVAAALIWWGAFG